MVASALVPSRMIKKPSARLPPRRGPVYFFGFMGETDSPPLFLPTLCPPPRDEIVEDSENDVQDSFGLEPLTTQHLLSLLAQLEDTASEEPTKSALEKQRNSTNHSISVSEISSVINESFEKRYEEATQKIQRVPFILRKVNGETCYNPMMVAIGPYHHGNEQLKQIEILKIQFTLQYVNESEKSIETLYKQMEKLLIDAKYCYAKDVAKAFRDKKFADMMFLDSCFVIQFMNSCVENNPQTTFFETLNIMRDIMLLENQLPFKILEKLMSLSSKFERVGKEMIDKFIKLLLMSDPVRKKEKEPIHLLELVQTKVVDDDEIKYEDKEDTSLCLCSYRVDNNEIKNRDKKDPSLGLYSYRSVQELKSVGIHFQPNESLRFSDITFESMLLSGRLRVPQTLINSNSKTLLLNLMAFETCADSSSNPGVSAYVSFMDMLIDSVEDVKELRSKGIILNFLGNDEQVANFFNEIGKNLVIDIRFFGTVKESLNTFYRSRRMLWLAEFRHNHFRSPWSVTAFFAAIVFLGLAITQTVFSGIQL